ncbi:MAG: protoheme IX farnesyltransferase [Bacteroidetes bacterium]|nr:MAG: protoheme IX farnesyltransferase [Bacteroidota bacterium]
MISKTIDNVSPVSFSLKSKLRDYSQLLKLRLTLTVVFSAAMGFILAPAATIDWPLFWLLVLGGTMVVGAANGINQVIERDYDKMMVRTANRPVATQRMGINEAIIFSLVTGLGGVFLLGYYFNDVTGYLALFSLISYAFIYTPLKRISPIAVFVGAFPGAVAPMLGWTAVTGSIDAGAIALFVIQFFWQFPHFWAVAWILDDDYRRAGFYLLPSFEGRGKKSAFQVLIWTTVLIPAVLLPLQIGIVGMVSTIIALIASAAMVWLAARLYKDCSIKNARTLMFAAFIYLPVVLLAFVFDKV